MPTRQFSGLADGGGETIASTLLSPVFLSGEADGGGEAAIVGLGHRVLFAGEANGGGETAAAAIGVVRLFAGAADGGGETVWPGVGVRRAFAGVADGGGEAIASGLFREDRLFAGAADGGGETAFGHLTVAARFAGVADGGGEAFAEWDYPIPEVRDPLPGEFPGTVNLDRNPSLEYPAFGLTDWTADAGVTLTIDETDDAWHGGRCAKAAIPSGAAKRVRVASKAGLGVDDGRPFVAGIRLAVDPAALPVDAGEPVGIAVWLRAEYRDGTADEGAPLACVPPGEPPDWIACPTEPVATDPAKVLDRLVTVVEVPALAAGADLWLDGSQKEEDRGQRGTPFASGDLGAGHRWAGIAGLSPSIREPLPIGGGS